MKQSAIRHAMRRFLFRILVIGGILVVVTNGIYLFMVWLLGKLKPGKNFYLDSEIAFLVTCVVCLMILSILLIISYRKRKREIATLSEHIERVSQGDFSTQITYSQRDSMAQIYHDFNRMSAELASVQFLKKDFINNFSHEFKTPIASINGFASLMLERDLPADQVREYLTIIQEESDRLSRLTSNTILLSKLSSQEYLATQEKYNLGEQLRQCSIILSHEWLAKEQNFSGEFPDIDFTGNRELMQHLWLNLLGNAIRYTPRGGDISVTMTADDRKITVRVQDSGIGMTEETIEHLFQPYYQGKNHTGRQGLGLGLSIANQIVKLNEGSIRVTSKPGEGSTFTVELPLDSQH